MLGLGTLTALTVTCCGRGPRHTTVLQESPTRGAKEQTQDTRVLPSGRTRDSRRGQKSLQNDNCLKPESEKG